jgi:hypothetical protein
MTLYREFLQAALAKHKTGSARGDQATFGLFKARPVV